MRDTPNFGEFYPKSLVPINKDDLLIFLEKVTEVECCDHYSHWLIALEGREMNLGEDYYHWQVVVFPAEINGGFDYKYPLYVSSFFLSIEEAIDFTSEVEKIASQGQLFTIAG
ncbi:hypothetical protein [Sutcliffiella halmapala]|uniref:hypothetical protein n=1 Tax=Sutcliffiella halmapala TaxID=79882 RepID=UPI000995111B|nr:hypothetical protein [Sutcliffiella halmapala]